MMCSFPSDENWMVCNQQCAGIDGQETSASTSSFAQGSTVTVADIRDAFGGSYSAADLDRLASMNDDAVHDVKTLQLVTFARWLTSMTSMLQALSAAAKSKQAHPTMDTLSPDTTGLALVKFMDPYDNHMKVELIQWTRIGFGRVADIVDGRVVAIVPIGRKRVPTDFRESDVIHPCTGVHMERVKKKERPTVPDGILRLRLAWQVCLNEKLADQSKEWMHKLSSSSDARQDLQEVETKFAESLERCEFCRSFRNHNVSHSSGYGFVPDWISQCSVCLLSWHMGCVTKLKTLGVLHRSTCADTLGEYHWANDSTDCSFAIGRQDHEDHLEGLSYGAELQARTAHRVA